MPRAVLPSYACMLWIPRTLLHQPAHPKHTSTPAQHASWSAWGPFLLTSEQTKEQRRFAGAHAAKHSHQLARLHVPLGHAHRGRLRLGPPHLKAAQRKGGGCGRAVLAGV